MYAIRGGLRSCEVRYAAKRLARRQPTKEECKLPAAAPCPGLKAEYKAAWAGVVRRRGKAVPNSASARGAV
jgi:hypothetical protein